MSTTPGSILDRAAQAQGLPRSEVVAALQNAVLTAAQQATGGVYRFEADFEDSEGLRLYQCLRVVDAVDPSLPAGQQLAICELGRIGMEGEFELGDDFMIQIFFRADHATHADLQERSFGHAVKLAHLVGLQPVGPLSHGLVDLWPMPG